jgi:hypothetical protein
MIPELQLTTKNIGIFRIGLFTASHGYIYEVHLQSTYGDRDAPTD